MSRPKTRQAIMNSFVKLLNLYPLDKITVCGKTGTAQHSSGGSDHGAFVCFAPMEDPEIAIAVFGEKVAHGSNMPKVTEPILKAYFEMVDASEVYTYENQLS